MRIGIGIIGAIGVSLALAGLSGCQRSLAPAQFVTEYEKTAVAVVESGPVRFLGLLQTSDYLAAKSAANGAGVVSNRENGMAGIYYKISFRDKLADAREAASSDIGGQASEVVLAGETLRLLQSGFSKNVRLIDGKGHSVAPLLYHFERGYPPQPLHSLQFVFPANDNGQELDLASAEVVLDEFGLNTGEVRLACRAPKNLHLKVKP